MNSAEICCPSITLKKEQTLSSLIQVLGASFLIAIFSQIQIPLYFTPIPLSGQTLAILLVGTTLGARKGMMSVLLYIFQGSFLNLPFFSNASFGFLHLFGPSGGYIFGFIAQAYLAGYLVEKQNCFSAIKTLMGLIFCCILELGIGTTWLAGFVGWKNVLTMGFYPFIIGEVIKSIAVTGFLKSRNQFASIAKEHG